MSSLSPEVIKSRRKGCLPGMPLYRAFIELAWDGSGFVLDNSNLEIYCFPQIYNYFTWFSLLNLLLSYVSYLFPISVLHLSFDTYIRWRKTFWLAKSKFLSGLYPPSSYFFSIYLFIYSILSFSPVVFHPSFSPMAHSYLDIPRLLYPKMIVP